MELNYKYKEEKLWNPQNLVIKFHFSKLPMGQRRNYKGKYFWAEWRWNYTI